jgi:hypothetical protein
MSYSPSVAVVILNWNNASDTLNCLDSVFNLDYPNFFPIVVDNGSKDDSVNQIRSAHPSVEILETGENLGYAEGNNYGIRHAIEIGADYVFVLNNDTLVSPTILDELVSEAEENPKIGIVGPTVYMLDAENILYSAGSFIDWRIGRTWHRGMYQSAGQYADLYDPEMVDFIPGCGMLVRSEFIKIGGYFNSQYYLNYEDVEWCVRASKHGYEVLYVPKAVMWHKDSATIGHGSPMHTYYLTRNALLFFYRNTPHRLWILPIARLLFSTLRTIGAWSVKPKYRSDIYRRRRTANLLALRDFFLGRFDEMGKDVASVCIPGK